MGNFLASLLWRLISYKSIFSILPELWNLICSCTKEKEIVLSNLFPDFHICPIQCSYYEASIKCKFHIACATSLHSSCADMLWKLTPRNQHFRNGHIVIWNKYNLKKLNRRKKKTTHDKRHKQFQYSKSICTSRMVENLPCRQFCSNLKQRRTSINQSDSDAQQFQFQVSLLWGSNVKNSYSMEQRGNTKLQTPVKYLWKTTYSTLHAWNFMRYFVISSRL